MHFKCQAFITRIEPQSENERIELTEFTFVSDLDNRTKTAEISLPRFQIKYEPDKNGQLVAIKIPNQFARGEKIRLTCYYINQYGQDCIKFVQDMYVARTEINRTEIKLFAQDEMYNLKAAKVPDEEIEGVFYENIRSKHYVKGVTDGKNDLIEYIKEQTEAVGYEVGIFPPNLEYLCDEYEFIDMTLTQILNYMYDNFVLTSFTIGRKLWLGRPYEGYNFLPNTKGHLVSFLFDNLTPMVKTHSLTFYDDTNNNILIEAKNFKRNGEVDTIRRETSNGEIQREINPIFYNLGDKAFKESVEELINQMGAIGFEGTFTTYGNMLTPEEAAKFGQFVNSGYYDVCDIVQFNNVKYSDKVSRLVEADVENNQYLVEKVVISYSTDGIQQDVTIGKAVKL